MFQQQLISVIVLMLCIAFHPCKGEEEKEKSIYTFSSYQLPIVKKNSTANLYLYFDQKLSSIKTQKPTSNKANLPYLPEYNAPPIYPCSQEQISLLSEQLKHPLKKASTPRFYDASQLVAFIHSIPSQLTAIYDKQTARIYLYCDPITKYIFQNQPNLDNSSTLLLNKLTVFSVANTPLNMEKEPELFKNSDKKIHLESFIHGAAAENTITNKSLHSKTDLTSYYDQSLLSAIAASDLIFTYEDKNINYTITHSFFSKSGTTNHLSIGLSYDKKRIYFLELYCMISNDPKMHLLGENLISHLPASKHSKLKYANIYKSIQSLHYSDKDNTINIFADEAYVELIKVRKSIQDSQKNDISYHVYKIANDRFNKPLKKSHLKNIEPIYSVTQKNLNTSKAIELKDKKETGKTSVSSSIKISSTLQHFNANLMANITLNIKKNEEEVTFKNFLFSTNINDHIQKLCEFDDKTYAILVTRNHKF